MLGVILLILGLLVVWYAWESLKTKGGSQPPAPTAAPTLIEIDDRQRRRTAPENSAPPIRSEKFAEAKDDRYLISYGDADGVVTDRRVDVRAIELTATAIYLRAYCHLRMSERTFRADRVLSARRLTDDLVIADPEAHFGALVPEDERPDPEHDAVMTRVWSGLKPLIWIARADRDISSDEMEVLLAFIAERNGLAGQKYADTRWNKNRAITRIDAARPTLADAAGTIARISPTSREMAMLKHYAATIAKEGGSSGEHRYRQLFKKA